MLILYQEDANNIFKELMNMININKYSIEISIKLKEGKVIQLKK